MLVMAAISCHVRGTLRQSHIRKLTLQDQQRKAGLCSTPVESSRARASGSGLPEWSSKTSRLSLVLLLKGDARYVQVVDLQSPGCGTRPGTFLGLSSTMVQRAERACKATRTRHLVVDRKSLWSRQSNSKAHTFLPWRLHQELAS